MVYRNTLVGGACSWLALLALACSAPVEANVTPDGDTGSDDDDDDVDTGSGDDDDDDAISATEVFDGSGGTAGPDDTTGDDDDDVTSTTGGDDDDDDDLTSTTSGARPGDCCEPQAAPECEDADITACVCREDAFCCEFEWDDNCVDIATAQCGACGGGTVGGSSSGDGPAGSSSDSADTDPLDQCCDTSGAPGCANPDLEACVCALDPFCCSMQWDDLCVQQATLDCDADCTLGGFGGDCCLANGSPGCEDDAVTTCVCDLDPFCCSTDWDALCVDAAVGSCDADCGTGGFDTDCCVPNGTPGCDNETIEDCVCAFDAFCCSTEWDALCVGGAIESCDACLPSTCCIPHGEAGCSDPVIEACVCALDAFCCEMEWDMLCVGQATADCDADCDPLPPPGPDPGVACCDADPAGGCPEDAALEACVCAIQDGCCDVQWAPGCVVIAENDCGLVCE